jgi:hypothetical protein
MNDFFKSLADYVFSFGMFMFLFVTGIVILFCGMIIKTNELEKQTQLQTEACYAQGMVLVHTDAGQRCVDPKSLVKVK